MAHHESRSKRVDDMLVVGVEDETINDLAFGEVKKKKNLPWNPMTA